MRHPAICAQGIDAKGRYSMTGQWPAPVKTPGISRSAATRLKLWPTPKLKTRERFSTSARCAFDGAGPPNRCLRRPPAQDGRPKLARAVKRLAHPVWLYCPWRCDTVSCNAQCQGDRMKPFAVVLVSLGLPLPRLQLTTRSMSLVWRHRSVRDASRRTFDTLRLAGDDKRLSAKIHHWVFRVCAATDGSGVGRSALVER